ncbi:NADAR family protein, partial [Streptomyces sp. TRM76130]|nr:NADAR family protein [Streptomyces sp. TRM76130]
RVLVEASPVDRIWGIGLSATDEGAGDPERWRGANLLGFALMEARRRLRSGRGRQRALGTPAARPRVRGGRPSAAA